MAPRKSTIAKTKDARNTRSRAAARTTTKTPSASTRVSRERPHTLPDDDADDPAEGEPLDSPLDFIDDLATQVNHLASDAARTHAALDEVRERLDEWTGRIEAFDQRFDTLTELLQNNANSATTRGQGLPAVPALTNGTTPREFVSKHLSWIDQTLLSNIVSRKLEIKDLVRLIPEEDRPKGRSTAGLSAGFHIDVTGKTTIVSESTVAFDKDFPDFPTVIYALSIYGAIRGLYDIDNTGIATGIFLHIKRLTRWHKIDNFQWKYIRAYFIAHFRTYQTSDNPLDWMNTDLQLFAAHIRSTEPTQQQPMIPTSPTKGPRKGQSNDAFCINYNTEGKGCSWKSCSRPHICSTCGGDHPSYKCKKREGPKP